VHPKASWTSLIWALYQVDNAKDLTALLLTPLSIIY